MIFSFFNEKLGLPLRDRPSGGIEDLVSYGNSSPVSDRGRAVNLAPPGVLWQIIVRGSLHKDNSIPRDLTRQSRNSVRPRSETGDEGRITSEASARQ